MILETPLPESWVVAPLRELLLALETGSRPKGGVKGIAKGVPSIGGEHLDGAGGFRFENIRYVPESFARSMEKGHLLLGDVLVVKDGATTGKVSFVGSNFPFKDAVVNEHVFLCRCELSIVPKYVYFYLLSEKGNGQILDDFRGAAQGGISQRFADLVLLPIAPQAEQVRIVDKLEVLFSDLDAGVIELNTAQKKLTQFRQSLLKAAVEGALTAEWRVRHNPDETGSQLLVRILADRRKRWESNQLAKYKKQGKNPPTDWRRKYSEPAHPDITNLPELPEGWCWACVEQLGNVQLGRQRSPNKIGKANPTPYIRAANITEGGVDLSDVLEMDFSETEKETFSLKVGDVLLTEASGSPEHVGRPAIWRQVEGLYCFQNTVLRFTPEGIGSEYAFYSFLAMQKLGIFSKLSGGVGINHLSAGKFSKLAVPLPPVLEQLALVDILKTSFSKIDDQLAFNAHSLKQSSAQRQNILRAAFVGKLVPQDPNDEPANVLLERIRVERAERNIKPKVSKTNKHKEIAAVVKKLMDVLAEAGDWVSAQEVFRRCGVSDGTDTDKVEALYVELRALDKAGRLAVETVKDMQGRKLHDRLKLLIN
jgi:type I restriction enzyme S subunit